MLRKKWVVLLVITMVMAVFAMPTPTEKVEAQSPFRVAVVMPSATNDLAFSQSIVDGLQAVQDEMGADNFEYVTQDGTFVVDDAAVALRQWALEGYDLVIAHGSQYGEILVDLAPEFPDVSFAWGTDSDTFGYDNVFAYEAASQEGGFVNGVLAATLTESDVIGIVGPIEVGDAKLYVDGFVTGAEWANANVTVNVNYIGSFSDVALASEAAEAHVANGADILSGTAQMVVGAVGVASDRGGVLWFGTQANQTSLDPEIVVASQVYHWEVVLMDMISLIQEGTLGGQSYQITLANGGLVVEVNEDFGLTGYQEFLVGAVSQGIIDGTIVIDLGE